MAADNGNSQAQYNCGAMYYPGEGVERDLGEARKYWELAAAQGHQESRDALATLRGFLRR